MVIMIMIISFTSPLPPVASQVGKDDHDGEDDDVPLHDDYHDKDDDDNALWLS